MKYLNANTLTFKIADKAQVEEENENIIFGANHKCLAQFSVAMAIL
jgi:hypothetical protein